MITLVKCPAELNRELWNKSIFLAGGITGCPDWQKEFVLIANELYPESQRILVDPRRDDFDISDPLMTEQQIAWEYKHLRYVSQIAFWFPKETLCPITLFELGAALERDIEVVVGCHPEYQRAIDLKYQIKNHWKRQYMKIVHSITDLVRQAFIAPSYNGNYVSL